MRDALRWQRELAERESESADRLRALDELRDALQHPDDVSVEKFRLLSELRDSPTSRPNAFRCAILFG
jgi:hypothetical protein